MIRLSLSFRSGTLSRERAGRKHPIVAGFTLVEILVVMAVVGLLVALLLPSVHQARSSARRTQCANHLRQLALAAHGFHTARGTFPPGLEQFEAAAPPRFRGTSLFSFLLPYLENGNLLQNWNYESPLKNADGGLAAPTATVISVYLCPADTIVRNPVKVDKRYYGITSYGGNGGSRSHDPELATVDGLFHTTGPASEPSAFQAPVALSKIRDGASHTILFGERSHHDPNYETFAQMYWCESLAYLGRWPAIGGRKRIADVTLSALAPLNFVLPFAFDARGQADGQLGSSRDFAIYEDLRKGAYGSGHPGGANVALADGSVHFLDEAIPQTVLEALCTRDQGETGTNWHVN